MKNNNTPLIKDSERRSCPHHCPGNLKRRDDGSLFCHTCCCTPHGSFEAPPIVEEECIPEWDELLKDGSNRATYRVSGAVRMVGGFEEPWSHEHLSRDGSLI